MSLDVRAAPALPSGPTVPPTLSIRIGANLSGIVVRFGGPSDRDPLGQRREERFYPDLESALSDLRDFAAFCLQGAASK